MYSLKEAFYQTTTNTASQLTNMIDLQCYLDDVTRTISPTFVDITNTIENPTIWNADMTNKVLIQMPLDLLAKTRSSPKTQDILNKWNIWAYDIAIKHGFDTIGYQYNTQLFFGKQNTVYNGITYNYARLGPASSCSLFGATWINHVFKINLPTIPIPFGTTFDVKVTDKDNKQKTISVSVNYTGLTITSFLDIDWYVNNNNVKSYTIDLTNFPTIPIVYNGTTYNLPITRLGNHFNNMFLNFRQDSIINFKLSNTITDIHNYAFNNVTSTELNITLSESLKTIGYSAFNKCSGLKSIIIPASVTSIESVAFNGNTMDIIFNGLTLPALGGNAFSSTITGYFMPSACPGVTGSTWNGLIVNCSIPTTTPPPTTTPSSTTTTTTPSPTSTTMLSTTPSVILAETTPSADLVTTSLVETPVETSLVETPVETSLVETPVETSLVETPVETSLVETPVETPVETSLVETSSVLDSSPVPTTVSYQSGISLISSNEILIVPSLLLSLDANIYTAVDKLLKSIDNNISYDTTVVDSKLYVLLKESMTTSSVERFETEPTTSQLITGVIIVLNDRLDLKDSLLKLNILPEVQESSNELSGGEIAGIVIGVILLLILIGLAIKYVRNRNV